MKFNQKLTLRKIDHVLGWASAVRAKYIWTKIDQMTEDFLLELRKKTK